LELVATEKFQTINVGLRINPQVGLGTIKEMSTSGATSKFGIALNDYKESVLKAYERNPWLNGIHIHVGSQGHLFWIYVL
jgi:diaminopimelate decarboxylase